MAVKIIESISRIASGFVKEMASILNKVLPRTVSSIKRDIQAALPTILRSSPVYEAIVSGTLSGDFGIPKGQEKERMDGIIEILSQSIEVRVQRVSALGQRLLGGLEVYIMAEDFNAAVESTFAKVVTDDGKELNWMEWLLFEGDKIIVAGYDVKFGNFDNSRSGKAIMVKSRSNFWRVPPQFSGTETDNWITRAIEANNAALDAKISLIVQQNINRVV